MSVGSGEHLYIPGLWSSNRIMSRFAFEIETFNSSIRVIDRHGKKLFCNLECDRSIIDPYKPQTSTQAYLIHGYPSIVEYIYTALRDLGPGSDTCVHLDNLLTISFSKRCFKERRLQTSFIVSRTQVLDCPQYYSSVLPIHHLNLAVLWTLLMT